MFRTYSPLFNSIIPRASSNVSTSVAARVDLAHVVIYTNLRLESRSYRMLIFTELQRDSRGFLTSDKVI